MRALAELERFFERLFERPTARLFKTRLQPIQIQRRIERAMENERLSTGDGTMVPNRFAVHLSPMDMGAIGEIAGSLAAELADAALTFARAHRYTLADRPQVELVGDPDIRPGEVRVAARYADAQRRERRRNAAIDPGGAGRGRPNSAWRHGPDRRVGPGRLSGRGSAHPLSVADPARLPGASLPLSLLRRACPSARHQAGGSRTVDRVGPPDRGGLAIRRATVRQRVSARCGYVDRSGRQQQRRRRRRFRVG